MKKDNISRRDFIKLALTSIGAFLASCLPQAAKTTTPTPTSTNTSTPDPTSTATPTSTPTNTPTPTAIPCFRLLSPENGTKLPAIGKVTFSWEAMPGATRYQLQFTFPSGQTVSFDIESASNTRYIETFIAGGIYIWQVVALGGDDSVICIAESFTFEKPAYVPPQNSGGGGNDGGGNDGGDSGDGGGNTTTTTVDSTSTDGTE